MLVVLAGLLLTAGAAAPSSTGSAVVVDRPVVPDTNPAPAVASDTVRPARIDSLFRVGLDALAAFDEGTAMQAFSQIVMLAPNSPRAPEAMYDAAYLYYRRYTRPEPDTGTTEERVRWLQTTRGILNQIEQRYPNSRQARAARTLHPRVCSELATRGDTTCAEEVRQLASGTELRVEMPRSKQKAKGRGRPEKPPRTAAERDSAVCRSEDPDAVVAAISSVWKTDTTQAIRGVQFVLEMLRQGCMAGLRERTILTMMDRQVASLVPLLLDVAKHDPDVTVRRRAVLWLSAQPSTPVLARDLQELQRQAAAEAPPAPSN